MGPLRSQPRRYDRERRYAFEGRLRHLQGPIFAYSFEDDVRAPERCVRALHELYKKTEVEHRHMTPQSNRAKAIGHIGFFFPTFKHSLWKQSLEWLRAH